MILRRLVTQLREHDWTAVAIEFVIVVLGVFVGIQVSNWNEGRIERAQERLYLLRLHEDFEASIAGLTRDNDFLAQQLSDQAIILAALDACAVPPADDKSLQRGMNTLGYINAPRFFRRTIDELAAAGRTDVIQNETIKDRLADIVAMVEWRGNGYDSTARTVEHYRYIVEEQIRYDFSRSWEGKFIRQVTAVDYDIQKLCHDPSIASAVSAISFATQERLNAYAPVLDRYRAFLPLLEEELRSRWGLDVSSGED